MGGRIIVLRSYQMGACPSCHHKQLVLITVNKRSLATPTPIIGTIIRSQLGGVGITKFLSLNVVIRCDGPRKGFVLA